MTSASAALLKTRPRAIDILDVPALPFLVVDGVGAPDGDEFAAAVQALYGVSYALHFLLKKEEGQAPSVGPLEALWWVDGDEQALVEAIAAGTATAADTDRSRWHWRALISQPSGVDADLVERAIAQTRAKRPSPALDRLRFEQWAEGRCAQVLHIGPYADESSSIVRLHQGLREAGYVPRGRHHEIYLSDPRRTAPEKVRTILRQPVTRPRRSRAHSA